MKHILLATVIAVSAFAAQAQTVGSTNQLGQAAESTALNAGNNQTSIYNSAANNPITAGRVDQNVHTNQSASVAPSFGVQGYGCALPGSGLSVQFVGGGISGAKSGDLDAGCTAPRDIQTMRAVGMPMEDQQRRACAVKAIADASPMCKALLVVGDQGSAPVVAQQPKPWQSGG